MNNGSLASSLATARGQFAEIPKRRQATVRMKSGGQYTYKYADLSDIFVAVDAALSDNGIAVMQTPVKQDGQWMVKTVLTHGESGDREEGFYPIFNKDDGTSHPAQNWSAGFTFSKRYALCGMLGVAAEESIEGDHSIRLRGNRDADKPHGDGPLDINDDFETGDGIRMPKGAKVDPKATPREKAESAAEAILAQFLDPKTAVGLNGAWNRNEVFINKLAEKHNDLYQSVFDAFHAGMAKFGDGAA